MSSSRSWRSPWTVPLVGVAVVAVAAGTIAPAAASSPVAHKPLSRVGTTTASSTGSVLRLLAYANEGAGPANEAAAVALATTHDIITAQPKSYAPYLAAMRAANPQLKVLVYLNGMFSHGSEGSKYAEASFSHDLAGKRIGSVAYGNYLMSPNSSEWVLSRVADCKSRLVASGYDGCMLDMLGTAPLGDGYGSGLPINPATPGQVWTTADWLAATGAVATAVGAGSGKYVMANGLGSGGRYWNPDAPTSVLLNGADAGISESWMRTSTQSLKKYPTELVWQKAVDEVVDAGVKGKTAVAMVKLWATDGTTADKDAWHRFGLASFMLATDGSAVFFPSYSMGDAATTRPYELTDLGAPAGPYTRAAAGYYSRTFARGFALVNPTKIAVTVNLGRPCTLLNGTVTSTVTLPPSSGELAVG